MKTDIPILITILGNEEEIFVDVDYEFNRHGVLINSVCYGDNDILWLINPVQMESIQAVIQEIKDG